ncbi:MAG: fibronectin type III domain-containing protein [Elusimicrobiota bacterium]
MIMLLWCMPLAVRAETGLPAPTNLVVRAASANLVQLRWVLAGQAGEVEHYVIERSIDGKKYQQVGTAAGDSYADTGLAVDKSYFYRVYAVGKDGSKGAYSEAMQVATLPVFVVAADKASEAAVVAEALPATESVVGEKQATETASAPQAPTVAKADEIWDSWYGKKRGFRMIPNYYAAFTGGQYFFAGEAGGLSGNTNVVLSPAMEFSPEWSLIPVYSMQYKGTKQIADLVGGGTLFQQSQDHSIAVKGVYRPNKRWAFKPSMGFKTELLQETKNEDWGKGLFDYRKPSVGMEAEYIYKDPFSVRLSYDFYGLYFINYDSLESQMGSDLSRELAGTKVLDSLNHSMGASANIPVTPFGHTLILQADYMIVLRDFGQQHVVLNTGQYQPDTRKDTVQSAGISALTPVVKVPAFKLTASLGYAFTVNDSNQNSYDAGRTFFNEDYYDYTAHSLSPRVSASVGRGKEPVQVSLGTSLSMQDYGSRKAQDVSGAYLGDTVDVTTMVTSLTVRKPLQDNFYLTMNSSWGHVSSDNMKYEKVYRYNYNTANYLFGFSYEY